MGAGNSVEVPGGGTEGYHVLRVSLFLFHHSIINICGQRMPKEKSVCGYIGMNTKLNN